MFVMVIMLRVVLVFVLNVSVKCRLSVFLLNLLLVVILLKLLGDLGMGRLTGRRMC